MCHSLPTLGIPVEHLSMIINYGDQFGLKFKKNETKGLKLFFILYSEQRYVHKLNLEISQL